MPLVTSTMTLKLVLCNLLCTARWQRQCCGFGGVDDYVSGAWNSSMERHRPHAVAPSSCCSFGLSPCLSNGTDPAEYYAEV